MPAGANTADRLGGSGPVLVDNGAVTGYRDLIVRPARESDDAALLAIEKTAWDSNAGFPSLRNPAQARFFDDARLGVHIHHVAVVDGEPVGYVRLAPINPLPEVSHVLGVPGLAVAPHARRRGVAGALVDHVIVEAGRRGAHKLTLSVMSTNPAAIRLYRTHGFRIEGRLLDQYYIDGRYVDSLLMAIRTRPPGGPAGSG